MSSPAGASVAAKRLNSHPDVIKAKLEQGQLPDDLPERGFIRLSKTATRIMTGQEDVREWDNEEIRRGRRHDKNGGWRGRDPIVVPMALHQEAIRRTFEEAQEIMREGLVPAVRYLAGVIEDEDVEAKDRLKAVQMLLDRVLGKPLERVEIKGDPDPWEDAVVAAVVPLKAIEGKEAEDNASTDTGS